MSVFELQVSWFDEKLIKHKILKLMVNISSIKLHENSFSGYLLVLCRQNEMGKLISAFLQILIGMRQKLGNPQCKEK
jgi:hypothetical protein